MIKKLFRFLKKVTRHLTQTLHHVLIVKFHDYHGRNHISLKQLLARHFSRNHLYLFEQSHKQKHYSAVHVPIAETFVVRLQSKHATPCEKNVSLLFLTWCSGLPHEKLSRSQTGRIMFNSCSMQSIRTRLVRAKGI